MFHSSSFACLNSACPVYGESVDHPFYAFPVCACGVPMTPQAPVAQPASAAQSADDSVAQECCGMLGLPPTTENLLSIAAILASAESAGGEHVLQAASTGLGRVAPAPPAAMAPPPGGATFQPWMFPASVPAALVV